MADRCPSAAPWWASAVGYQVYLRSFADASGDGVGDLEGLRQRLPHIAGLGVDCVWITPFYPSPQADHGYDVADYRDVDPVYGDLDGFTAVVAEAHDLGLRVVVDLVPNHTSDQHPWFQEALTGPNAATRDYYVWRDPAPDGGPPNNWVSKFGGPAWNLHAHTGQYYMHLFLPEQPDLNWANPAVADEFDEILRWWLDRGVDGFRIDTAHLLVEDADFRDNPVLIELDELADPDDPEAVYHAFDHRYDADQPGVVDVYRRWHEVVAPRGGMLLGEVFLLQPHLIRRYVADDALDLAFYFPALKVPWDADAIRTMLVEAIPYAGSAFAWPLSSHDDPRAAERFGGGARGAQRALAYLTLLCGLPGTTFLLQGDELGLDHGTLAVADRQDPISVRNPGATGRDGARTPVPWEPGPHLGFSDAAPWLPLPVGRGDADTVAAQETDPCSPLRRTRQLLATRADLPELRDPDVGIEWLTDAGPLLAYRRGRVLVAMNTAATSQPLPPAESTEIRYATADRSAPDGRPVVPPEAAVIATVGDRKADRAPTGYARNA